MPRGLITRLDDVTLPDTFPVLLRDALDAQGVLLIHDYPNPDTFPSGVIVPWGTAGQEATRLYNLARRPGALPHHDNQHDGIFYGPAGTLTYTGKGFKFSKPNGLVLTDYIAATGLGSLTPTLATNNWLGIAWFRIGATGTFQAILGSGGNQDLASDPNAFALYSQDVSTSATFYGTFRLRDQANVKHEFGFSSTNGGLQVGQLVQLGWSVHYGNPNSELRLYRDGALVRTVSLPGATAMQSNTLPLYVGAAGPNGQGNATVHRLLIENLAASGRAPLAVVQQDFSVNSGRFG